MSSPTSRPMNLGSNIRRPSLRSIILDSDSKPPESSDSRQSESSDSKPPESSDSRQSGSLDSRQSGSLDSKSPESLGSRQSGSLDSKSPESLGSRQSRSLDSKSPESLDSKPPKVPLIDLTDPIKRPRRYSSMTKFKNMETKSVPRGMHTTPFPRGISIRQFGENVFLDWADPIKKVANGIGAPGSRVRPLFKNIGTAVGVAAEIAKRNRYPWRRYGQGKTKKKKKNKKTFINTLKKAYKNRKTKKCKSKKCHKKSRRK
jgi:hypothetical protein